MQGSSVAALAHTRWELKARPILLLSTSSKVSLGDAKIEAARHGNVSALSLPVRRQNQFQAV